MGPRRDTIYRFDPDYRLSMETETLRRGGTPLNLRPKTLETLVHLLENPGRLVTKSELMEAVWPGAAVTDDVLVQSIADIRRALGDDAREPNYIQTVPRRGYIFLKPVEKSAGSSPPGPEETVDPWAERRRSPRLGWLIPALAILAMVAALALWQLIESAARDGRPPEASRSSLVVLPFEVQSDRPAHQWLSRGLADLIGTGLWQAPGVEVISQRRLQQAGAGGLPGELEAFEIARELGAERVVAGRFYRLGEQIQINASLLDANSREAAFTARERLSSTDDIFQAVDRICLRVLQQLAVEKGLQSPSSSDVGESTTTSLKAYRHYVTGLDHFLRGGQKGAERARLELEKAVRVDPSFAMAHFKLAQVEHWACSWGYSRAGPTEALRRALPFTEVLPERERLLLNGLHALWMEGRPERALQIWERLSDRYPVFSAEAGVPSEIVRLHVARGELEKAILYGESILESVFLSPEECSRLASHLARAYRTDGRLGKAVAMQRRAVQRWPLRDSRVYAHYLINLGRYLLDGGQREEAMAAFQRAVERASGDASNLTDLGWGYYMAGEKAKALALAEAALEADADYGNAHHLKGWILLSRSRYRKAARSLTRAFEQTPPQFGFSFHGILGADVPALYYSGVALQEAGETGRARQVWRSLVSRCQALREEWSGQSRPPLDLIQTYTYQALARCRLGEESLCRRTLGRIPASASRYYELCQHLARIHSLLGDSGQALDWLRRSIESGSRELQHIKDNPDFAPLRNDPRFARLTGAAS